MNSFVGRLYPSSKFAIMILFMIVSIFTSGYFLQYAILPIFLIISLFSGTAGQLFKTFMKSIFIIVLFIFLIQIFIVKNEDSQQLWGFVYFSKIGLTNSLTMTSRIVAISTLMIWFFQVTSVKDIVYSLEKSGIPKKVNFVILSTIQLIPQMTNLSKTITDAQKARGIETEGSLRIRISAFVPMLGPLVLSSIQQTEERVLALESRGFSTNIKKTSIYVIHKKRSDYFILISCSLLLVIYIIWRVVS